MDGWITIGTNLDTKNFEREYKRLTKRVLEIRKEQFDIQLEIKNREKVGQDIKDLTQRMKELADEEDEVGLKMGSLVYGRGMQEAGKSSGELSENLKSAHSSLEKSVKSAGKLVMAIVGAAGAFALLKRASSELASYDEEYAANLEYIRFVLTQAIAPVLKAIVQLIMQLLQYLNLIAQAWFGVNLFANGSVEAFNKMKRGANGVSKAVKQIKKDLLGFDEINMLTDQSDTGTRAGAGGVGLPNFDISQFEGEKPQWLEWIIGNKDLILGILAGIATAFKLIKLRLDGIMSLKIGLVVMGIVKAISALLDYLDDPSWFNFGNIIEGIGIAIIGLGTLFLGLPGVVAGAIVLVLGVILKYWDKIRKFFQEKIDWLTGKSDWVREVFGDNIGDIYDLMVEDLQNLLDIFDIAFTTIKKNFDEIIQFFQNVFSGKWEAAWQNITKIVQNNADAWKSIFGKIFGQLSKTFSLWGTTIGNAISSAFKTVINAVLARAEMILNTPIRGINALIGLINNIPGVNLGYLSTFSLPRLAVGGIVNMPNTGTLVGGAIAGESGREGVIPLTDTQAMAQLGREIGRWITVNATITNSMNGRVISRELKQIQNEQDFAYNT